MPKTIIHVNSHIARANVKNHTTEPAIVVRKGKSGKARYARRVIINGPSAVVSAEPGCGLKCGASIWIETEHEVHTD